MPQRLIYFSVMPFGLTNAPAIFQELMNRVPEGFSDFATTYLEDILTCSEILEKKHLEHTQLVFDRVRKHDLRLQLKK